ncbi:hypothetical protein H4F17_17460, partial [Vibrio cholerae]
GSNADAGNSNITVAQLQTVSPALTGLIAGNEAAYQAYIGANPNAFSSPATATELQAMVNAVNTSQDTLTQVDSNITVTQLQTIIPPITGLVTENEASYQAYIAANPGSFSSPATAAEVQAMVNAVNMLSQVQDIFSSQANTVIPAEHFNSQEGVSGAKPENELAYVRAIKSGIYFADPKNPTPTELQNLINVVNSNEELVKASQEDEDFDALTSAEEAILGTLISSSDSSSSGVLDSLEDSDGDGVLNVSEFVCNFDPLNPFDPVGRVQGSNYQPGDNLPTWITEQWHDVLGNNVDIDGDGISNTIENALGTLSNSANERDLNNNSIPDVIEAQLAQKTGLRHISTQDDTDSDGLTDYFEITHGSNLLDANSPVQNGASIVNGHTLAQSVTLNGDFNGDDDGDGVSNIVELNLGYSPFVSEAFNLYIAQNAFSTQDTLVLKAVHVGFNGTDVDYQWNTDDALKVLETDGSMIKLNASGLSKGIYSIEVTASKTVDSEVFVKSASYDLVIREDNSFAVDINLNGIPDSMEQSTSTCLPPHLMNSTGKRFASSPGYILALGNQAQQAGSMTPSYSATKRPMVEGMTLVDQIYDLRAISITSSKSDALSVVVPVTSPLTSDSKVFALENDVWRELTNVKSANYREDGECPLASEAQLYSSTIQEGDNCLLVTVREKSEIVAFASNQLLVDSIQFGVFRNNIDDEPTVVRVGSSAGSLGNGVIILLLGLVALLRRKEERNA